MRMAKDPEKVKTFLVDLAQKLRPLQGQEVKVFLDYKKEEVSHEYSNPILVCRDFCTFFSCRTK
jgi:Zn-dependent oligopeptidase